MAALKSCVVLLALIAYSQCQFLDPTALLKEINSNFIDSHHLTSIFANMTFADLAKQMAPLPSNVNQDCMKHIQAGPTQQQFATEFKECLNKTEPIVKDAIKKISALQADMQHNFFTFLPEAAEIFKVAFTKITTNDCIKNLKSHFTKSMDEVMSNVRKCIAPK